MSMEFVEKVKRFSGQKASGDILVMYNSNLNFFFLSHLISGSFIISLTLMASKNMHKSVPDKESMMIVLNFKTYSIVLFTNSNIWFFSNSRLTDYHTCRLCLQMMEPWLLRSLGQS